MDHTTTDYQSIIEENIAAISIHTVVLDSEGRTIDYVFDYVNPAFEGMTGLLAENIVGRRVLSVLPETEELWLHRFGEVARTGVPIRFESFSRELGKYYQVLAFRHKPLGFTATFTDISDRVLAHKKEEQERLKYQSFFELGAAKLVIDQQTSKIIDANPIAEKFYGYTRAELQGMKISQINTMSEADIRKEMDEAKLETRGVFHFRHRLASGKIVDVDVHSNPGLWEGREALFTIVFDMSEHNFLQQRLKLALSSAKAGTWEWDLRTNENIWSQELWTLYGLSLNEVVPSFESWLETVQPEDRPRMIKAAGRTSRAGGELNLEWRVNGLGDELRWLMSRGTPERDESGKIIKYVGVVINISDRKLAEDQLVVAKNKAEYSATHDYLTGLPNRVLLDDRISNSLLWAKRRKQRVAVCVLDIDNFKNINDCHGHQTGDEILKRVANGLKSSLRDHDSIARIGGDEFVLLLSDFSGVEEIVKTITRVLLDNTKAHHLDNLEIPASFSLGAAIYPEHGRSVDALLKNADRALYAAKTSGKHTFSFFQDLIV